MGGKGNYKIEYQKAAFFRLLFCRSRAGQVMTKIARHCTMFALQFRFSAGKIDGVHGMMNTEKKNNESYL